jgi:hypothetical protein
MDSSSPKNLSTIKKALLRMISTINLGSSTATRSFKRR